MKIHPTTFTLEHIPKTLSPTGNITSAPKDFAVYVSAPGPGAAPPQPVWEPPGDEPCEGWGLENSTGVAVLPSAR